MTVTIGVSMPPQHGDMPQLRKAWEEADRLGADRIYTFDHFFTLVIGNPNPTFEETHGKSFEATSIQAAMAVTTTRAEISSLVHCTAYRNPNLLADIALTIDHLSGGRFVLGIGSGWFQLDFDELATSSAPWRADSNSSSATLKLSKNAGRNSIRCRCAGSPF